MDSEIIFRNHRSVVYEMLAHLKIILKKKLTLINFKRGLAVPVADCCLARTLAATLLQQYEVKFPSLNFFHFSTKIFRSPISDFRF